MAGRPPPPPGRFHESSSAPRAGTARHRVRANFAAVVHPPALAAETGGRREPVDVLRLVLVRALRPEGLAGREVGHDARPPGSGRAGRARLTRCISTRRAPAFQAARCRHAERSKSAPSSRFRRTRRLRLKAAVTPSGSSYAASSSRPGFTRSVPRRRASPGRRRRRTAARSRVASPRSKFPMFEPRKRTRHSPLPRRADVASARPRLVGRAVPADRHARDLREALERGRDTADGREVDDVDVRASSGGRGAPRRRGRASRRSPSRARRRGRARGARRATAGAARRRSRVSACA